MNLFENVEGMNPKCLCGKKGHFRFYAVPEGYLCLDHLQFWLSEKTKSLLGVKG